MLCWSGVCVHCTFEPLQLHIHPFHEFRSQLTAFACHLQIIIFLFSLHRRAADIPNNNNQFILSELIKKGTPDGKCINSGGVTPLATQTAEPASRSSLVLLAVALIFGVSCFAGFINRFFVERSTMLTIPENLFTSTIPNFAVCYVLIFGQFLIMELWRFSPVHMHTTFTHAKIFAFLFFFWCKLNKGLYHKVRWRKICRLIERKKFAKFLNL